LKRGGDAGKIVARWQVDLLKCIKSSRSNAATRICTRNPQVHRCFRFLFQFVPHFRYSERVTAINPTL